MSPPLGRAAGLTLLLGGARSGKSALATRWGATHDGPVVFVATAEGRDAEMRTRIARHRDERPAGWSTVEAPLDPASAVHAAPPDAMVIVDCLTLWVANVFERTAAPVVVEAARSLCAAADGRPGPTVVISNEVGMGIVPTGAASRRYRDLLGTINATVARHAAQPLLVIAGQVLALQPPPSRPTAP